MDFRTIAKTRVGSKRIELLEGIAPDGGSTGHYKIRAMMVETIMEKEFPRETEEHTLITVLGVYSGLVNQAVLEQEQY